MVITQMLMNINSLSGRSDGSRSSVGRQRPPWSQYRNLWKSFLVVALVLLSCVLLLIYASGGHVTDLVADWSDDP